MRLWNWLLDYFKPDNNRHIELYVFPGGLVFTGNFRDCKWQAIKLSFKTLCEVRIIDPTTKKHWLVELGRVKCIYGKQ